MSAAQVKPEWLVEQIESRSPASLIPYARNARTHSEAQIAQLAGSIREFGFTIPVIVDEAGTIIAGHGRVLAAQLLELAEIPVMVAQGWSEAKKRAYVLADNKLAENAGWDDELLKVELQDLLDGDFNLDLTGFSLDEVASALDFGSLTNGDDSIPLIAPNQGDSKTLKMSFGSKSAPMTDAEHAALLAAFEAYVNEMGVPNGFVGRLLDVRP